MVSRRMVVLYGSQSGTAQEYAERIWRESKRSVHKPGSLNFFSQEYHFTGPVKAMDDFSPPDMLHESLLVFVCSTTGQGNEPENMKTFWRFLLRKNLPYNSLVNCKVAVFGLGDSSYTKYNFVAKRLHKRLQQLGANPVTELGLGDDQHDMGPDAAMEPWLISLWEKLAKLYPLPDGVLPEGFILSPPKYNVKIYQPEDSVCSSQEGQNGGAAEFNRPFSATLMKKERTTSPMHFQDVKVLTLEAPELKYKPGDVLLVQPCNMERNVLKFLDITGVNGDTLIELKKQVDDDSFPLPPNWLIPQPCTVFQCALDLFDLQAIPQRYTLQLLAHFTTSDLEKERLLEFCAPSGQQELYNYCHRPKRSTLEVLQDFPNATAAIPLEYYFDIFRAIKPRPFSIASAAEVRPCQAKLLVAVVNYKTRLHMPRIGLCSNYLANLERGDVLSVWIRKGSFTFPPFPEIPVIMVGPGTGCAPFVSFIEQRSVTYPDIKGKLFFFYGCRYRDRDFHFRDQIMGHVNTGIIRLFCAFSRDQENKLYVQDSLQYQADLVWELLSTQGAAFYVAGNAKNMPDAVRETLINIAQNEGGLMFDQAEAYVTSLEQCGRYQTETWS